MNVLGVGVGVGGTFTDAVLLGGAVIHPRSTPRSRGDHDSRRHALPLHERRLPPRHASARSFLGQYVTLP